MSKRLRNKAYRIRNMDKIGIVRIFKIEVLEIIIVNIHCFSVKQIFTDLISLNENF